jgi:hypothetical protein
MPWIPSSVETRAKSQFFHGFPAINVSIEVIFILVPKVYGAAKPGPP